MEIRRPDFLYTLNGYGLTGQINLWTIRISREIMLGETSINFHDSVKIPILMGHIKNYR